MYLIQLVTVFGYFIFGVLNYKDFYSESRYCDILNISLGFYTLLFILNIIDKNIQKNIRTKKLSTYINNISIYTTIISYLTNNIEKLLAIRTISWLFIFSCLLLIDDIYVKSEKYNKYISILLSQVSFIFYIFYNLLNENLILLLFCWLFSIIFLVYYTKTTYNSNNNVYIKLIWLLYGFVYFLENADIITKGNLYILFTIFDILSKYIFVYSYQILMSKNLSNYYTISKVIRLFHNSIEMSVYNNLINKEEYNEIIKFLDLSEYDIDSMKTMLLDELFPDNTWKIMLSPFKTYKNMTRYMLCFVI